VQAAVKLLPDTTTNTTTQHPPDGLEDQLHCNSFSTKKENKKR